MRNAAAVDVDVASAEHKSEQKTQVQQGRKGLDGRAVITHVLRARADRKISDLKNIA